MYAKVFRSLWDGTLAESWETWSVFVFLLAHADLDGTVEMTAGAIARRSCIPLERVEAALSTLQCPDPASRSDAEGGRRLIPLDGRGWGWRIVNYMHYRTLKDAEMVRHQTRERVKRHRNAVSRDVTPGNASKRHVEVEVDVEAKKEKTLLVNGEDSLTVSDWFEQAFWPRYPKKVGKADALKAMKAAFRGKAPGSSAEDELGDRIMAGLGRYVDHVQGKDREYVKHPGPWIRAQRWEDEYES